MIRLVALDLDDTLLAPDLVIPAESVSAVQAALSQGTEVVVATGRMFRSARPYAEQLGVRLPLITYNGALVKDVRSGRVHSHNPVPLVPACELAEYCSRERLDLIVYLDDDLYVARRTPLVQAYEEVAGLRSHVVDDLGALLREAGKGPTKELIVAEPSAAASIADAVASRYPEALHVMRSRAGYVEIVQAGVDKWTAVSSLATRLGIESGEIMAMGDSLNDRGMVNRAGLGVTVPHAPECLRQEADFVTTMDNGLGVAEALRKFVLNRG